MNNFENTFLDPAWDRKLQNCFYKNMSPKDLLELRQKLSNDSNFREAFGDWVRGLREIGLVIEGIEYT